MLKVHPNNVDTLKVLGALYARSSASEVTEKKLAAERKEKARKYLMKVSELTPDDIDVQLDLAVLLQRSEFNVSLIKLLYLFILLVCFKCVQWSDRPFNQTFN